MARLYNGKTWEEMNAIYTKQYKDTTPEEREYLAGLTKDDYDAYVMEKNYATAQPNTYYLQGGTMQPYTGWNGGSVTGADMMAAVDDSLKYGYDIQLDPRNNAGAREAINNTLLDASERANLDAINGSGDYETNRQDYLNQIGWTDYQSVFESLQNTGTLGLKDMDGVPIEQAYELGNPNFVWTGGEPEYVANVNLATGEKNTPSAQQTPQSNVIDMTTQPIAGVPNVEAPLLPYEPDYSGLQALLGQQGSVNNYAGDLSSLQQTPTAALNPEQSAYLAAMQGMTLPEIQQYVSNLGSFAALPGQVPQYNSSLADYAALPEQMQQYVSNLGNYSALPEQQALDLSSLQNLLQLPQSGQEVMPYEGNLNALLRTPEQQAAYTQQLQALQQQYAMPEVQTFSYNPEADPVYQAYLQQFTRDANQGMRDTLGQISARTGGLASSYAGQAAQQTYNDYVQQAADALPQLYQAAWGRWVDEQQMAQTANANAYNRALDALDRQTAAEQTDWERQAYVDEQAYNRYQNELARQLAAQQAEWDRQAYVEGESYNRQQNAYQNQLAANQAEWERQAYLDELNYARQQDEYNQKLAANQEAWDRQALLDQLNYQRQQDEYQNQLAANQAEWERQAYLDELAYGRQQDQYNQQLTANQAQWERNAYLDELLYGRQLDEINRQTAAEQEAWDRNAYLEGLNYERYLDELDRQTAAEQREWERQAYVDEQTYQREQDALDRQTAANQTEWERQAYAAEMAYKQQQDELQRQLAAEQTAWERQAYADEQAYARQQDELEWQYRNAQLAQQQADSNEPVLGYEDILELLSQGLSNQQLLDGYEYYVGQEHPTANLADQRISGVSDYNSAISYLKSLQADKRAQQSLITESEWNRKKQEGGSALETGYNSYQEYLWDYLNDYYQFTHR